MRLSYKKVCCGVAGTDTTSVAGRAWTTDEERTVVQLRTQGLTRGQIGVKLGRSPLAIKKLLARMDVSYTCPKCRRSLPPTAFGFGNTRGIPPCKTCQPPRHIQRQARRRRRAENTPVRLDVQALNLVNPLPHPDEPVQLVDVVHAGPHIRGPHNLEARSAWITEIAQRVRSGTYELPTVAQWVDRLDTELCGKVISDMVRAAKRTSPDRVTRRGRIPASYIQPADLREHLPRALLDSIGWP